MEIKLELDTEKLAKAVVTVTAIIGLCWVSERSENHSLASKNALAIIIIIAIIYYPRRV
jgi:hypothetical protein